MPFTYGAESYIPDPNPFNYVLRYCDDSTHTISHMGSGTGASRRVTEPLLATICQALNTRWLMHEETYFQALWRRYMSRQESTTTIYLGEMK